jgi:hypothetical protein
MSHDRGCGGTLAVIVAAVLAASLAVLLLGAVLAFEVGRVVFSAEEVAQVVGERAVDSGAVRRLVIQQLLDTGSTGATTDFDLARALSFLDQDEVEGVFDLLIPPDWARSQLSEAFRGLYDWMDNDLPAPAVPLDLRPIQQSLISGGAARVVETILDSWPACTVQQLDELSRAALAGQLPMQYCEPSEPYRSAISVFATQALIEQARALPPKIDLLARDPAQPTDDPASVMALKEQLRFLRALTRWGWLLPFSFLGLIMALVVRSLRGLARWWGLPLLAGGLLSFFGVFVASALAERLTARALQRVSPDELVRLLGSILDGLRDRILGRMIVHSLLIILGAGLLLALGLVLARRAARTPAFILPAPALTPTKSASRPTPPTREGPQPPSDPETPTGMFG